MLSLLAKIHKMVFLNLSNGSYKTNLVQHKKVVLKLLNDCLCWTKINNCIKNKLTINCIKER